MRWQRSDVTHTHASTHTHARVHMPAHAMRTRTHRRVNRSMQVRLSARRHTHMHGLPLGSLDRFWATIFGPPCARNCPKSSAFGHRFLCIVVGARGFRTVCLFCSALTPFVRSASRHAQSAQMKERGQAVQHCKLKLNSVGSGRTALNISKVRPCSTDIIAISGLFLLKLLLPVSYTHLTLPTILRV